MSTLHAFVVDGPCTGSYDVPRAPARMVFTRDRVTGQTFALDVVVDSIEPTEDAFVYEARDGVAWMCGTGPGMPCRSVTFEFAGAVVPDTFEFVPASDAELKQIRAEGWKKILAWASGRPEPAARPRPTAAPIQQEVLFS